MEIENPPAFTPNTHPVLQALNEKVATLEAEVAKTRELSSEQFATINRLRNEKFHYQERVKNVLVEALEDYDEETIKHIARQLDIELTKTKTIEVNVTFNIDVEYEIGEEPDPEWDFEFDVRHDSIVDFTSDVVYAKES